MKQCFIMFFALAVLALPVKAQVFAHPGFVGPDGQKKVGDYVWVWHTGQVSKSGEMEVEADCPIGYVVTGGGYLSKDRLLFSPRPNAAFDGWVVTLEGSGYGPGRVTVYAGCAPAK
jgi:hypothetical protein